MTHRPFSTLVCGATLAALAACSSVPLRDPGYGGASSHPQQPPMVSQPAPVGQGSAVQAQYGTVRTIDIVPVEARRSGAGAVLGAVLGAVVGNQVGSGSGRAAATVAGAVGGGVAGHAIEGRVRRDNEVYRVAVRFDDGTYREFDFQRIDDLRIGDRIRWDGSQFQRL